MSSIEEELRATFARHEARTPAAGPVRARIDIAWVRAKRRRLAYRAAGVTAVVVMAGAAVPVTVHQWQHTAPRLPAVDNLAQVPAPAGPIDVLLLGSDHRAGRRASDRRADTVMLIHVPADRSRTYLVSLPRDGEVKLPGGDRAKLSETLFLGGPALTEKIVTDLTGVTFDATVTVDFAALRAVTAAIDGVEICLPLGFTSIHNGKAYPRGCQHLGAQDVVPVLQNRYHLRQGSYDRDHVTQLFVRALTAKLTADGTLHDPARMHKLLTVGRTGLVVDGDLGSLLAGVQSLTSAEVVGVSAAKFAALDTGRERIYPQVGPKLYAALRDDTLDAWTEAHPAYVMKAG